MSAHRRVRSTTDLIMVLWESRWTILWATLVAGLVTAALSLVLPRTYRAEVRLMIAESRLSGPGSSSGLGAFFNPRLYHTFEGIIVRSGALVKTLDAFPQLREKNYEPDDLAELVDVQLISNSRLVRLSLALPDPQLAADVANFLADEAKAFTQTELFADEADSVRTRLAPELEAAQATFEAAEARLARASENGSVIALEDAHENLMIARAEFATERAKYAALLKGQRRDQESGEPLAERMIALQESFEQFRQEHNAADLEVHRRDLWRRRSDLAESLHGSETDRARLEGELATLQEDEGSGGEIYRATEALRLSQRLRGTLAGRVAAGADMAALEASLEQFNAALAHASLEDEHLKRQVEAMAAEYSLFYEYSTPTLEALVEAHDAELALIDEEVLALRVQIGTAMTEQTAAEAQLEIAGGVLGTIQTAHSEAALRLEEKHQGLVVISRAIPPHYAEFPKKKLLTILAAAVAFVVVCAWVVTRKNLLAALEEGGQS
jgi:uncharacterized protein involved in exopolysaccharide biosynthesis